MKLLEGNLCCCCLEGDKNETLQELQHHTFKEKVVTSKTFVKLELLPLPELVVEYISMLILSSNAVES